jgi:hypothetical protein
VNPAIRTRLILVGVALCIVALAEWVSHNGIGGGVHTALQNYYRYGDAFFTACWLAGALAFAASRPNWRSLALYVAVGAVCEAYVASVRHEPGYGYRLYAGGIFGIVGCVWAAAEALYRRTEAAVLVLLETLIFPALLLAAILPLDLTTYLHPTSLDGRMLLLEQSLFGMQPSWIVGRWFDASGVFRGFETLVYVYLPTASGVVYLLERRSGRPNDIQVAFITAGIIGIVLLQLAPVAGPTSFRPDYPDVVPAIEDAIDQKMVAGMRWRNSIPSLHTTWSLLIYWHARPHGLRPRLFGATWVVLTILAMLGLGEHFLADVAITIPFAVAMRAVLATRTEARARQIAFAAGALFYFGWVGLLRAPEDVLANPWLLRLYAISGVACALWAERRLYLAGPAVAREAPPPAPWQWLYVALFANGLLALSALRSHAHALDAAGIHRGAPVAFVVAAAAGAISAKKIGALVANIGFAVAAVVAFVGWTYLPLYLADFELVTWGDAVLWLAGDVMTGFFVGPAAFFAGAAITSTLRGTKLGFGVGAAVAGAIVGLVLAPSTYNVLVGAPLPLALAFLHARGRRD